MRDREAQVVKTMHLSSLLREVNLAVYFYRYKGVVQASSLLQGGKKAVLVEGQPLIEDLSQECLALVLDINEHIIFNETWSRT